jgi:hypothetical protein
MPNFVDVAFLQSELESFVRKGEADATSEASQVLSQAEALLLKVLVARHESGDQSQPVGDYEDGSWHATIVLNESGEQDVLIFRGRQGDETADVALEGTWASIDSPAAPRFLTVQIGDRAWGMRETEHGRSLFNTDGNVVGPGDAQLFAELAQSARQTLSAQTQPQNLAVGWVCSRCHWPNRAEAVRCQLCQTPKGAAGTATQASSFFGGAEFEGLPPELTPSLSLTGARSSIPELLEPELDQILFGKIPTVAAKRRKGMFCTHCGSQIKRPGQKFCSACGTRIQGSQ